MANDALKIVTQGGADQAKRPLARVSGAAEELDPARLMDMLGNIDGLKREIQERVRRIEAVKQAKSLLLEEAARTEALNRRLAEIGKAMSAAHSGFATEGEVTLSKLGEDRGVRRESRESAPKRVVHEGVALAWPKAEDATPAFGATALDAAPASIAAPVSIAAPLDLAASVGVEAREASDPLAEAEIETAAAGEGAETVATMEPEVLAILGQAVSGASLSHAGELVEELVQEARRLLDESSARLQSAAQREEQAAADLEAGREAMAKAFDAATGQLDAAELRWKQADAAVAEARRLFQDSTAQLAAAVGKEQQSSADFHSAQRALTAAYEAAGERLAAAQQYARDGDGFAAETRKLLARMEVELGDARGGAATAAEDLRSARQELTTSYQFASVAAQRRLDSAEFYRKTASWVIFSTAFAWMLAIWMAWVAFNRSWPMAIPFASSCLILAGAVFLRKRAARDVEEN